MAELSWDGDDLVVSLSALEKAEAAHGDIRVPASSVRDVEFLDDVLHAGHGPKFPGARWPGRLAIGTFYLPGETKRCTSPGRRLHIDDFGTGYSSLRSLRDMPVDILKIDKSFVDHIAISSESARLVRMILQLANDFHMYTVAEGVEDLSQVQILQTMGCRSIQGYHFSKPIPAAELETLLQEVFAVPGHLRTTEALVPN